MWMKEKGETTETQSEELGERVVNTSPIVPQDDSQGVNAFVGRGVEFKGIISYKGTVRIDGELDGEIHTEGTLLVGEEAIIKAKVTAGTIICKGKITGDIKVQEKIKLRAPAVINGSVTTPMLSMEEGVFFNGTCEMNGGSSLSQRDSTFHELGQKEKQLTRSTG